VLWKSRHEQQHERDYTSHSNAAISEIKNAALTKRQSKNVFDLLFLDLRR
jgi:hypothetical protein